MITTFYIFKKREERPHIKQRLEDTKNLNFWIRAKISE